MSEGADVATPSQAISRCLADAKGKPCKGLVCPELGRAALQGKSFLLNAENVELK